MSGYEYEQIVIQRQLVEHVSSQIKSERMTQYFLFGFAIGAYTGYTFNWLTSRKFQDPTERSTSDGNNMIFGGLVGMVSGVVVASLS